MFVVTHLACTNTSMPVEQMLVIQSIGVEAGSVPICMRTFACFCRHFTPTDGRFPMWVVFVSLYVLLGFSLFRKAQSTMLEVELIIMQGTE